MDVPPTEYAEKLVRYFRSLQATPPGDESWSRELRFAEELAQLTRQVPLEADALRSLLRRLEEARAAGEINGTGGHEVYMTTKCWAQATLGE